MKQTNKLSVKINKSSMESHLFFIHDSCRVFFLNFTDALHNTKVLFRVVVSDYEQTSGVGIFGVDIYNKVLKV